MSDVLSTDTGTFEPLNPVVKTKWLEALRSGEYKQGRGYLRPQCDTFCCLGVLTDLYNKDTGNGSWVEDSGRFTVLEQNNEYSDIYDLVQPVEAWAKVDRAAANRLSGMNDDGSSFSDIADFIENRL